MSVLSSRLQLPLRRERLRYLRDLLRRLWTGTLLHRRVQDQREPV
ncbi:hypothetical protein EYF80_065820 [Liparis tanakae]|uniref:Uncharacterized protein n=1 Tax=Liparis tanakae TaxID=230148 RepID=A0A4Z2E5Q3_9TELE|nr:hypothetical protein EYF80_065820 [Liparis tanakae]